MAAGSQCKDLGTGVISEFAQPGLYSKNTGRGGLRVGGDLFCLFSRRLAACLYMSLCMRQDAVSQETHTHAQEVSHRLIRSRICTHNTRWHTRHTSQA